MKPVLNGTFTKRKLFFSGKLLQSRGPRCEVPALNGTLLQQKKISVLCCFVRGRFHGVSFAVSVRPSVHLSACNCAFALGGVS